LPKPPTASWQHGKPPDKCNSAASVLKVRRVDASKLRGLTELDDIRPSP
jgi:hypothetical protein